MADPLRPGDQITEQPSKGTPPPPFEYLYELSNADGSTTVVKSPFALERSCRFQHEGRTYEAVGFRSPGAGLPIVPCIEILSSSEHARELPAEAAIFLRSRGFAPAAPDGFDEPEIRDAVLAMLAPHFEVETEVVGLHPSGCKLRIDALLQPKDRTAWRNKNLALGLEFKRVPSRNQPYGDSALMAQCLDYSHCNYLGVGEVLVFACPLPFYLAREAHLLRFLALYGVGHVSFHHIRRGLCLKLGDGILWCEREGVHDLGRRSMLSKTFGNRDVRKVRAGR